MRYLVIYAHPVEESYVAALRRHGLGLAVVAELLRRTQSEQEHVDARDAALVLAAGTHLVARALRHGLHRRGDARAVSHKGRAETAELLAIARRSPAHARYRCAVGGVFCTT